MYPLDSGKEFHLLVYTYFTSLQPSSTIINGLGGETFCLVSAGSETFLCSIFGWLLPEA
jgi:hypothetical protein